YDHAHESPPVMYLPLVILAVMAVSVAWNYQYIGYFAIAAAFFVGRALQQGWFKNLRSSHEEHEDVEHEKPEHYTSRDHADTGHVFPAHPHAPEAEVLHGARPAPSEPPLTWSWVAVMAVSTVLGGWLIQQGIAKTGHEGLSLAALLEQARPQGTLADARGPWTKWTWPNEHTAHLPENASFIVVPATLLATASWAGGILLAAAFFWWGTLNAEDVRRQFAPVYNLLVNKWWFDELYDAIFVQPTMVISRVISGIDKRWIDGFLDWTARACVWFSRLWDLIADRTLVDGFVNLFAAWTYSLGVSLHAIQTGRIRQFVMVLIVGALIFQYDPKVWFNPDVADLQATFNHKWIPSFNIDYFMGLDGISFPLLVLTAFVCLLAMGASWGIEKFVKGYCVLFLLLETGMLGVFAALDFFLFYVFWEVMLLPMYFLIGVWGGPRKEYAAIKFFLYTLFGSVLMLIAILMLYFSSDLSDPLLMPYLDKCHLNEVAKANAQAAMSKRISNEAGVQPVHTFNIMALAQ